MQNLQRNRLFQNAVEQQMSGYGIANGEKEKLARVQEVKTQNDRDRRIDMECTKAHELTV